MTSKQANCNIKNKDKYIEMVEKECITYLVTNPNKVITYITVR